MPNSDRKFSFEITGLEPQKRRQFRLQYANHAPSWKRGARGFAELRVSLPAGAPFLEIDMREAAEPQRDGGKWSEKQTFLTLERDEAHALYEFLKYSFECPAAATMPLDTDLGDDAAGLYLLNVSSLTDAKLAADRLALEHPANVLREPAIAVLRAIREEQQRRAKAPAEALA